MNQTEEMKEQFDGLFYKAVSRILFYPDSHRLRYANCLASMISAISQGNTIIFHEAYKELIKDLDMMPNNLQQGQKDLIGFFEGEYIPLSQRMQYLEMQVGKIGKMETKYENLQKHFNRNVDKRINLKMVTKSPIENVTKKDVSDIPKTKEGIPAVSVKTEEKTTKREKREIRCGNKKHVFESKVPIGKSAMCWNCRKENRKGYNFIVTEDLIIDE